ncbi:MAG: hypothetical protein Fur0046_08530 [Cyanobacteria bacterium J069]|nr:MAG: DUF3352 domain-containing protein [Cyanobacteria bacterium J069]
MKARSFYLALGSVALTLLLVAIAGFYWLVGQSPLRLLQGGRVASPEAAMFVPKQAPAMVSLLVKPEQLRAFRLAVSSLGDRRKSREELDALERTLLASRGLSYDADIKPWLGDEITLAVTSADIDRNPANGQQPGYLLALETDNPQQSKEFVQLFWQKRAIAGSNLVFEQYSGVKVIYEKGAGARGQGLGEESENPASSAQSLTSTLASAVVGDRFVLFANYPKVLRDAINNVQAPDLSLQSSQKYQDALETLPERQIGLTFVNLPQLGAWLGSQSPLGKLSTENTRQFDSLVAGIELARQGLLMETALLATPGQPLTASEPALAEPVGALQFVPPATPFSASGTNLSQLWGQLTAGLQEYGVLSALLGQPIAALEAQWGVTFEEDLVPWVNREFALGLVSPPGREPEWVFVAEKSPETAAGIENLNAIAQRRGLTVGPITLDDRRTYTWTQLSPSGKRRGAELEADVQGVHTMIDKYEVFTTSVEAMDTILKNPQKSLITAQPFQEAIAPLSPRNNGYLYLDWDSVRKPLEQRIPVLKLAELAGKPFFDHLRSLTLTSYGSDTKVQRGAVFVQLKNT